MSKPEWGIKRLCQSCGAHFYDLSRQPIVCPKCSAVFDADALLKKRRGRPPAQETKALPLAEEPTEELNLEEELEPLEDDDDLLEDTSDFGEDEDVVGIDPKSDED